MVDIVPGSLGDVSGRLVLSQSSPESPVLITGSVRGLPEGLHGFHVHQIGDTSRGCVAAGGHFNPFDANHGAQDAAERHVGDLGNIETFPGQEVTEVNVLDSLITLYGEERSIVGRTIVIHEGEDDLGQGGDAGSLKTGNAGGRAACGIIEDEESLLYAYVEGIRGIRLTQKGPLSPVKIVGKAVEFDGLGEESSQLFVSTGLNCEIVEAGVRSVALGKFIGRNFQKEIFDDMSLYSQSNLLIRIREPGDEGGTRKCGKVTKDPARFSARSVIRGGDSVRGELFLTQRGPNGPVRITGRISGLAPGKHGFHVHQKGTTGDMCRAAGGHYNPFDFAHSSPGSPARHVGDLGNIVADPDGVARVDIVDPLLTLHDEYSIIDRRSFVVHEGEDDLGLGGDEGSLKTGNAGGRVGCGVVREGHYPLKWAVIAPRDVPEEAGRQFLSCHMGQTAYRMPDGSARIKSLCGQTVTVQVRGGETFANGDVEVTEVIERGDVAVYVVEKPLIMSSTEAGGKSGSKF